MKNLFNLLEDNTVKARQDLLLLAIMFAVPFFQFLGRYPLIEPDEGRYSEIPREMLERGDFITPLLNYVKYFEKPPLLYWLNSLSFSIFGQNEFAARFPCALAGLLTILFTYWVGRKLFDRRIGILSASILGTSIGFLAQARINITDTPLTLCLTICLGSFILAVREGEKYRGRYYYLFYATAALAVLAKGLIGILFPGAIVFLFMLTRKRWRLLKEMHLFTGILLFLLIAAPWFILVSGRNPEFARFFFIHEHFERFLTKVHHRYQPLWFFIPVLLGTMLPWSFFIPSALKNAWEERKGEHGEALTYLAIWALFIFLFFSKSSSKLVPYILPVFPPLAIMIARVCSSALEKGARVIRGYSIALIALLLLIGAGLPVYSLISSKQDLDMSSAVLLGSIFLCQGGLAWHLLKRDDLIRFFIVLAVGSTLYTIIAGHIVYAHQAERKTSKSLALKVKSLAGPNDMVASFEYDQTLPFYAQRRIVVVGGVGELEFGSQQGDQSAWFLDWGSFFRAWDGDKPVFAVIQARDLEGFSKSVKTPPRIIEQKRRKVLISNR